MGGGLLAGIKAVLTWFNVITRCNNLLRTHTGSVKSRDSHIEHVKDNSYIIHSHAGSRVQECGMKPLSPLQSKRHVLPCNNLV